MIKLIDLTYYSNLEYNQPSQLIEAQKEALGFISFIKNLLNIEIVKHLNYEGSSLVDDVRFTFFKKQNRFWNIPFKTHAYIKKQHPDVVLVQGLIFPLQVLILRNALGRKCKIIVQHHGEKPFSGIKAFFQKLADKSIDAYLFTSIGNAQPWLSAKIISSTNKIFEVLEASTFFEKKNKQAAKNKLGLTGDSNFLWVGRLNANKDPLTVINAFEKYLTFNPKAKLFMIYHRDDLIRDIKNFIEKNENLQKAIKLIGKIPHSELSTWYNAANFYISASHKEGSGYALLEAMSCGCVPIVTDIPSYRTITANGKYALLYKVNDPYDLLKSLKKLNEINYNEYSENVQNYFSKELSFKSIAEKLAGVCFSLVKPISRKII
jgi:glycosyltransferase involved in cell wall biosynthesis